MGYYTCHSLNVMTADNSAEHPRKFDIIAELRRSNDEAEYALDEEGNTLNDAKWYDSSEDMKRFSLKHPDALFVMDGDGEGSEDYWIAYYRDGREQICRGRIEYDEFDESKFA